MLLGAEGSPDSPITVLVVAAVAFGGLIWVALSTERSLRRGGYRRSAAVPGRPAGAAVDADAARRWIGGCRLGRLDAPIPLAVLEADVDVAHVFLNGLGRGLSVVMPFAAKEAWVVRSHVTEVRRIGGVAGKGVFFASPSGTDDGVLVWGGDSILDGLSELGWPVVRA